MTDEQVIDLLKALTESIDGLTKAMERQTETMQRDIELINSLEERSKPH